LENKNKYAYPKISNVFRPVDRWRVLSRVCGVVAPHIHNINTRW